MRFLYAQFVQQIKTPLTLTCQAVKQGIQNKSSVVNVQEIITLKTELYSVWLVFQDGPGVVYILDQFPQCRQQQNLCCRSRMPAWVAVRDFQHDNLGKRIIKPWWAFFSHSLQASQQLSLIYINCSILVRSALSCQKTKPTDNWLAN